jgi:hypothetical protein
MAMVDEPDLEEVFIVVKVHAGKITPQKILLEVHDNPQGDKSVTELENVGNVIHLNVLVTDNCKLQVSVPPDTRIMKLGVSDTYDTYITVSFPRRKLQRALQIKFVELKRP